jgi:hypothetical protein
VASPAATTSPEEPVVPLFPPVILLIVPPLVIVKPFRDMSKSCTAVEAIVLLLFPQEFVGVVVVVLPANVAEPSETVAARPDGMPIVPLLVNVPFTNTRKPFVNRIPPESTVSEE